MHSTELLQKYNQVIRPYFASLSQTGLQDIPCLDQFLDCYIQDPLIMPFLCESFKQINDLYQCLNETNQQILNMYLKVRFFSESLAQSVACSLVEHFKAHDLMLLGEQVRAISNFSINNAKDYLNISNLVTIIVLKLASRAYATISERYGGDSTMFKLPEVKDGVLIDISPDMITCQMLAECLGSYSHLYAFATNPSMLELLSKEKAFKGVVRVFHIFKSIIAPSPNVRIYFDAKGNPFTNPANRVYPNHASDNTADSQDQFFLTRTIAGTLKETSSPRPTFSPNEGDFQVLKFSLNPNLLSMLLSSESIKAILKHKVQLIACSTYQNDGLKNTTRLDLNEAFGDCFGITALIKHIEQQKAGYKVQLQIDPLHFGRLQILFTL